MEQIKLKVIRFEAEDIITASGDFGVLQLSGVDDTIKNNLLLHAPGNPVGEQNWTNYDSSDTGYNSVLKVITSREDNSQTRFYFEGIKYYTLSILQTVDSQGQRFTPTLDGKYIWDSDNGYFRKSN